jgi:uncharacterized protein YcaQ
MSHDDAGVNAVPELSLADARRAALRAQGLLGKRISGGPLGVLHRVGAVQLDTISVLARSHELIPYARLGAVGPRRVERAFWGKGTPNTFEYWAHAACILPIADWPLFTFRRQHFRHRGKRWHDVPTAAVAQVKERLRAEGPLMTRDLGGGRRGGPWWDWSDVKVAVEWLLDIGEVTVSRRVGFQRVYDLAERVIPAPLLGLEPDESECLAGLVARAGRALGVATVSDLADYYRLTGDQVRQTLPTTDLVPVRVQGWRGTAFADPAALEQLGTAARTRPTLLSPFDSLIWDRRRTSRLFDFTHRLEAYVPAHKREHGYYAMPVLAGDRLVGRVDPVRDGPVLNARRISIDRPSAIPAVAKALTAAAQWVGCESVSIGAVAPPAATAELTQAVRR